MSKRYKILNDLINDCAAIRTSYPPIHILSSFAGSILSYIYEFHADELESGG